MMNAFISARPIGKMTVNEYLLTVAGVHSMILVTRCVPKNICIFVFFGNITTLLYVLVLSQGGKRDSWE